MKNRLNLVGRKINMLTVINQEPFSGGRSKIERKNSYGYFIYTGIDRMDPKMGYVLNNVVPCCEQCNYLKNRYSFLDFLEIISRIYNNLSKKSKIK
jgi:hypothetical protein